MLHIEFNLYVEKVIFLNFQTVFLIIEKNPKKTNKCTFYNIIILDFNGNHKNYILHTIL